MSGRFWLAGVLAAALALPTVGVAQKARPESWVGAWGYAPGWAGSPPTPPVAATPAPPMPLGAAPPRPAAATPPAPPAPLVFNPGGLPVDLASAVDLSNQTVRQAVRVSVGGARLRLRFSNESGAAPLALGAGVNCNSPAAISAAAMSSPAAIARPFSVRLPAPGSVVMRTLESTSLSITSLKPKSAVAKT